MHLLCISGWSKCKIGSKKAAARDQQQGASSPPTCETSSEKLYSSSTTIRPYRLLALAEFAEFLVKIAESIAAKTAENPWAEYSMLMTEVRYVVMQRTVAMQLFAERWIEEKLRQTAKFH